MTLINYSAIGVVHSPFKDPHETPLQSRFARRAHGRVELYPEYKPGLGDIGRFSHVILIYHCHLTKAHSLQVKPSHVKSWHGVFATRSVNRPNPIGISVVNLLEIEDVNLFVRGIDVVDGTPLLDIKPYIPSIDRWYGANLGWLADNYGMENETTGGS